MSDVSIDLDKRVDDISIILEKRGVKTVPPTRVGLVVDISGSTTELYHSGVMENTFDRCLAVAAKFDDNGEMDIWAFSSGSPGYSQFENAVAADYGSYVRTKLLRNPQSYFWHMTEYAPVMSAVDEFYFPSRKKPVSRAAKKPGLLGRLFGANKSVETSTPVAPTDSSDLLPAHVLFITDGANDTGDRYEVESLLAETENLPVYWNMIGVGSREREFDFIKHMADKFGHVGFVNLKDLTISDDDLYDQILGDEFVQWINELNSKA